MVLMLEMVSPPDVVTLKEHPELLFGSWFGAGLVEPLRSGLAVATVWPVAVLLSARSPAAVALVAILVVVVGVWSADAWQASLSVKDDRRIVIDEVGGYLAGMVLLGRARWLAAGGFAALFLTIDRLKPWPFDRIEGIPGAAGIVLDDVVVGLALGVASAFVATARRRIGRSRPPP